MLPGETAADLDPEIQSIIQNNDLLHAFRTLKYVNVALLVLLVYDYCLTFEIEKKRIWTLRWRMPKILYMVNRYLLPPIFFFDGLSNVFHVGKTICEVRKYTPLPAFPAIMTVDVMLIIRVLALYDNSKRMARFLIIQFLIQISAWSVLSAVILVKTRAIAGREAFTGCLSDIPNWAYLSWLNPLIAESILVTLIIYKCRMYGVFSPTVKILVRDSIVYFVSVTAIIIFNLLYTRHQKLIGTALTLPTSILASIATARLSMNIRSITIEQALSTLAHQTAGLVPTLLFRRPESISYGLYGEEEPSHDTEEPHEMLEPEELCSTAHSSSYS